MDSGGDQIGWACLVIETALEGAIGADERLQRVADIGIDGTRGRERGFEQAGAQVHQERLVFAQELLCDQDVLVGDFGRIQGLRLLVQARFGQVGAGEGAVDGDFALISAAQRTNFSVNAGAVAAWLAGVADFAFHAGGLDAFIVAAAPLVHARGSENAVGGMWGVGFGNMTRTRAAVASTTLISSIRVRWLDSLMS